MVEQEIRASRIVLCGDDGEEQLCLEGGSGAMGPGIRFTSAVGNLLEIYVDSGEPRIQFTAPSGRVACSLGVSSLSARNLEPGEEASAGFRLSICDEVGRPRLFIWPPSGTHEAMIEAFDEQGRTVWRVGGSPPP